MTNNQIKATPPATTDGVPDNQVANELRTQYATLQEHGQSDDVSSQTSALIQLVMRVTGLDDNQAKLLAYYAVMTHGNPRLHRCAILAVYGPLGTGKTTILRVLLQITHNPLWINGRMSAAAFRDALPYESTALVDEADGNYEDWLINRYERESSSITVKRRLGGDDWVDDKRKIFGATALHRRVPFRDPAILSRSVTIRTRRAEGVERFKAADFGPFQQGLKAVADAIPFQDIPETEGDRIGDTWAPLRIVAEHLGDVEWLAFASAEMEKARANMHAGQDEEPLSAVFQALVACAFDGPDIGGKVQPNRRVQLKDIVRRLKEQGRDMSSWQVGQQVEDLGFEKSRRGGETWVLTGGMEKLREVARKLDIEDELLAD